MDGACVYGIGAQQAVHKVSVNGGAWANIAGCCVTHIAADGGNVYGIGTKQEVYKVTGVSWAYIAGCCVSEISVDFVNVYGPGGSESVWNDAVLGSEGLVQLNTENLFSVVSVACLMVAVSGMGPAFFMAIARARTPRSEPLVSP